MKQKIKILYGIIIINVLLTGCASRQQLAFKSIEGKTHTAVTPVPSTFEWAASWWMPRFEAVNERLKKGNVDLLFIGNSITHGWENTGKEIWDQYYESRNAVNMGFSGDRTEHVLWRLEHSDFSNISPKLAVVMIGTNNSNNDDYTAGEIADGIIAICQRLRNKFPGMKILLLAIFPRGSEPSPQRQKNSQASLMASQVADGKTIHYLDINAAFLMNDGILSEEIMPDYLHPNLEGYRIWAEVMEWKIAKLLGEED